MPTSLLDKVERLSLSARATGRTYEISIMRPLVLRASGTPPLNCPIFILLDSSITFGTAVERVALDAALGRLQSAVLVGIGYPGDYFDNLRARTFDLTPPTPADAFNPSAELTGTEYGGADAFLAFLLDELLPAVRGRIAEASPDRALLHGVSHGGLFSAYALLKRPEAFESFSSISASFWWNGFALLEGWPLFLEKLRTTAAKPRVLVGVGGAEQDEPSSAPLGVELQALQQSIRNARRVDAAREFADRLHGVGIGEVEFLAFEGEDHAGALTAGTGRAIRFGLKV